jgi:hypothetical protein
MMLTISKMHFDLRAPPRGGIARDAAMGTLVRDHRTRHRYGHHRSGKTDVLEMLERFFALGRAECAERLNQYYFKKCKQIETLVLQIACLLLPRASWSKKSTLETRVVHLEFNNIINK